MGVAVGRDQATVEYTKGVGVYVPPRHLRDGDRRLAVWHHHHPGVAGVPHLRLRPRVRLGRGRDSVPW